MFLPNIPGLAAAIYTSVTCYALASPQVMTCNSVTLPGRQQLGLQQPEALPALQRQQQEHVLRDSALGQSLGCTENYAHSLGCGAH
jgi:hypothetical protein